MGGAPAVAHLYASLGYERVMPRWAKLGLWALVIGTALFCGRHAWAHQAFASTYSLEMVKIEGRVVEFLFRNPHSVVLVETPGEKRQTIT